MTRKNTPSSGWLPLSLGKRRLRNPNEPTIDCNGLILRQLSLSRRRVTHG